MFEDLDDDGLSLCRRALAAVGLREGMVTVLVDDGGQLPGPTVDGDDWHQDEALPDVRSPWTQRALLDAARERLSDASLRIQPTGTRYVVVGQEGAVSAGHPSPERALVAVLDPDGEE